MNQSKNGKFIQQDIKQFNLDILSKRSFNFFYVTQTFEVVFTDRELLENNVI